MQQTLPSDVRDGSSGITTVLSESEGNLGEWRATRPNRSSAYPQAARREASLHLECAGNKMNTCDSS